MAMRYERKGQLMPATTIPLSVVRQRLICDGCGAQRDTIWVEKEPGNPLAIIQPFSSVEDATPAKVEMQWVVGPDGGAFCSRRCYLTRAEKDVDALYGHYGYLVP